MSNNGHLRHYYVCELEESIQLFTVLFTHRACNAMHSNCKTQPCLLAWTDTTIAYEMHFQQNPGKICE